MKTGIIKNLIKSYKEQRKFKEEAMEGIVKKS